MTCQHCTTRQTSRWFGSYQTGCLGCAAALVKSARPLKHLQEGHLYQLTRRGKLTREAILAEVVKANEIR